MQPTDRTSNFETRVIERLDKIDQELTVLNVRVDTYQKASGQVVNLAFGLIATAVITIIVSALAP